MKRIISILICTFLIFSFSSVLTPLQAGETEQIPISQFVADNHVLMTRADGRLIGWGDNTYGQLGLGDKAETSYTDPVEITFFSGKGKIRQIAVIKDTSFVLLSNGELYSAGSGTNGKHGQGNIKDQKTWGRVGDELKFKKLYTNSSAEFALAEDYSGNLYAWGKNTEGQLGVGDTNARTSPALVKASANIKQLWLGETYVEFIDLNNNLFYWGTFTNQVGLSGTYVKITYEQYYNTKGEWGTREVANTSAEMTYSPKPVNVITQYEYPLPESQSRPNVSSGSTAKWYVYQWSKQSLLTKDISKVPTIAAGLNHSLMVYEGLIYGWGESNYKQLANITTASSPVALTAVNSFVATQKSSGINIAKMFVAGNSNYITFDDGSVWVWGDNSYNKSGAAGAPVNIDTPTKVTALQDVKIIKVVAGRNTNYYITDEGDIYASGSNINGVTGLGKDYADEATIDTPTKLGTIGFSETLTPPSAESVQITVPEKAESGKTIEVVWNPVNDATRYELKRTVVLRSDKKADNMMAKTEDVEVSNMVFVPKNNGMNNFLSFLSTNSTPQTVYFGSETTYTDTAQSNWESVTYELKAVNRIGDYSEPVQSKAVSIIETSNTGGGGGGNTGGGGSTGGNTGDGSDTKSKVTVPPVNVTVNPPEITVRSPEVSVQSPDIVLNYPELQSSTGTTSGGTTTTQAGGYAWMPTPEQLARLGLSFGGSSAAPYVITIEPSAPQYVQPTNSGGGNTLLYVIIFVLLTVLIGGMMFVLASWLFNKSGTEIQRLRFMLSSVLSDADD